MGWGFSGSYYVSGNTVTVDWQGLIDKLTTHGDTVVGSDGKVYVKR